MQQKFIVVLLDYTGDGPACNPRAVCSGTRGRVIGLYLQRNPAGLLRVTTKLRVAGQETIQMAGKGFAFVLAHGRRTTRLYAAGTQVVHEIAHIEQRPDVGG